jgi:hypothetical protein
MTVALIAGVLIALGALAYVLAPLVGAGSWSAGSGDAGGRARAPGGDEPSDAP